MAVLTLAVMSILPKSTSASQLTKQVDNIPQQPAKKYENKRFIVQITN
jgi:hypothetical protein